MATTLQDICSFQSGGTPSKANPAYFGGSIPWITTVALNGRNIGTEDAVDWITEEAIQKSAAKIVPAGSIMVGTRVGIGKVAVNTVPMSTSQDIISLINIDSESWDTEFLCRFIQSKSAFLNAQARGATIKGIKIEALAGLELPEATLLQQREIVRILNAISDIITARQRQLRALDTLIKARFVEMFGMPGTDINGWGLTPLGTCCEMNPKKGSDSRLVAGLQVSFVPMPAVSENGSIDTSEVRSYDEVKIGFTYFAENDVLFAKITPCMENGKGAVAVGLINGIGFGSTEFHVLRPIASKSNPYWLYTLMSFDSFRKDAAANMTGSAGQRRVPITYLERYKVALPPILLQEQFATFVSQVDKSKVISQFVVEKAA